MASARLTVSAYCGKNYWNSWKQNKLLQFHARLGHSLILSENPFGDMAVVSNFEKIEDQDQEYDESDCVDLFCCAMVSLDNKGIKEKNIR